MHGTECLVDLSWRGGGKKGRVTGDVVLVYECSGSEKFYVGLGTLASHVILCTSTDILRAPTYCFYALTAMARQGDASPKGTRILLLITLSQGLDTEHSSMAARWLAQKLPVEGARTGAELRHQWSQRTGTPLHQDIIMLSP